MNDLAVLDHIHLLSGPYATQGLTDLGDEVIEVEPPGSEEAQFTPPGRRS